ncbi:MAG TPA: GreA/GreB family elongation factor, partial [Myxococcota bacterium]|nr:GreA/GreB family elongation factor [Myxococcota bacterium]
RVAPARGPGDTGPVRLGDRVRVRGDHGERCLFLVGPDEVDLSFEGAEAVSILSPLGAALVGAEAGELVEVEQPGRVIHELEIVAVG